MASSISVSGVGHEIDVAVLAVELFVVIEGLADLVRGENVAFLQRKNPRQKIRLENQALVGIGAAETRLPMRYCSPSSIVNRDVRALAVLRADQRPGPGNAAAVIIHCLQYRIVHVHFEISVVLVEPADAHFHVFVQLGLVEGLAPDRNVSDVERNRVGAVVAHRANEFPVGKRLVARRM